MDQISTGKEKQGHHRPQRLDSSPSLTGLGIALGVQHDLWSPVPSCGNVLSQEASMVMLRVCYSGQTKVTDLEEGEGGMQLK